MGVSLIRGGVVERSHTELRVAQVRLRARSHNDREFHRFERNRGLAARVRVLHHPVNFPRNGCGGPSNGVVLQCGGKAA